MVALGLGSGTHDLPSLISVATCKLLVGALWVLVLWPGIEPWPPALGMWNLSHRPPGKSLADHLLWTGVRWRIEANQTISCHPGSYTVLSTVKKHSHKSTRLFIGTLFPTEWKPPRRPSGAKYLNYQRFTLWNSRGMRQHLKLTQYCKLIILQ